MLALTADGSDVYVESFSVPTACICNVVEPDAFVL